MTNKVCVQCKTKPRSSRQDSIFCDDCVAEMERELDRRLAKPDDGFDLFANIKKNAEASR